MADPLEQWECEYVVAPVYDAVGIIGKVSSPVKMPVPCYSAEKAYPPFPHVVDSFEGRVLFDRSIGDENEQNPSAGWHLQALNGTFRHPRTGELVGGGSVVVRPSDRIYIQAGPPEAAPGSVTTRSPPAPGTARFVRTLKSPNYTSAQLFSSVNNNDYRTTNTKNGWTGTGLLVQVSWTTGAPFGGALPRSAYGRTFVVDVTVSGPDASVYPTGIYVEEIVFLRNGTKESPAAVLPARPTGYTTGSLGGFVVNKHLRGAAREVGRYAVANLSRSDRFQVWVKARVPISGDATELPPTPAVVAATPADWTTDKLLTRTYSVTRLLQPGLGTVASTEAKRISPKKDNPGPYFDTSDWSRLVDDLKENNSFPSPPEDRGDGSEDERKITICLMQPNADGKIFPREGYRISWPWADTASAPHRHADRWLVWRRDHGVFGFVGTTSTTTGSGSSRRAVFVDPGIPIDVSDPPPFRRSEGAAFSVQSPQSWPGVSGRYAQRFVLGGYGDNPAELKFSYPGEHMDFIVRSPTQPDDSFIRELSSPRGTQIRHLVESAGLLVLTSTGEWSVGGVTSTITPRTAIAKAIGYVGCNHVPPVTIDSRVVFVNRPGTRIYAVEQEEEQGRLNIAELTTLVYEELFNGKTIHAMAWSDEERTLFVAQDKQIVSITFLPDSDVLSFSALTMPGVAYGTAAGDTSTPNITDIAITQNNIGGEKRDTLNIVTTQGGTKVEAHTMPVRGFSTDGRLLKDRVKGGTEHTVNAVLETFDFSPQTRLGRDERQSSSRGYAGANVGPEWTVAMARPFSEGTSNAEVKLAFTEGMRATTRNPSPEQGGNWPESGHTSDRSMTLFGRADPVNDASVLLQYSGDSLNAEIHAVGVNAEIGADALEGGLPALHVGGVLCWVPAGGQSIFTRHPESGALLDLTKDQHGIFTRGENRYIVDWCWAERSKLLVVVMSDGDFLVGIFHDVDNIAFSECSLGHLIEEEPNNAKVVVKACAVVGEKRDGRSTETLYLTFDIQHPTTEIQFVEKLGVIPLFPIADDRDTVNKVTRTDEVVEGIEYAFTSAVETFPLAPFEIYQAQDGQVQPDAIVVESYGNKEYPHEDLKAGLVPNGYGEAVGRPIPVDCLLPLSPVNRTELLPGGHSIGKRTVVATATPHVDTDYSVRVEHTGDGLMDIEGISIRFHEDDPLRKLKEALEGVQ